MIIQPVSVSVVTQAVERILSADHRLAEATVTRSAEMNEDPGRCPWLGVYRSDCQFPSRTLGLGQGYRGQRIQIMILAQESDGGSGAACEDRLNALVDNAVSALLTDSTLGGAVLGIDDFSVRYPDYRRVNDNEFMQTAMIVFTAMAHVGGTQ